MKHGSLLVTAFAMLTIGGAASVYANTVNFKLLRSNGAASACAPHATATVKVVTQPGADNFAEKMTITVDGLAGETALDAFVIQVPNAPFGLSWYVGDLETDGSGHVSRTFVSRFNEETFAVAPDSVHAPTPHGIDAGSNPKFAPLHTFHVGLWFNSPADATHNGCPAIVTPFNGEHTAGVQVLSSRNAGNTNDLAGPLKKVHD